MSDRVVLFVDYQNCYHAARQTYHDPLAPPWEGQFHPYLVGEHIVATSPFERQLVGVRIYRGLPSSEKDPKTYGAARAQIDAWQRQPHTTVISRPLRYPADWPHAKAEEKGIDVALAVDLVVGAVKGWYDVGIVMSLDTDLRPALEVVVTEFHGMRVEVAAWNRSGVDARRLSLPGKRLWCHWLDEAVYRAVQDPTDYTKGRA